MDVLEAIEQARLHPGTVYAGNDKNIRDNYMVYEAGMLYACDKDGSNARDPFELSSYDFEVDWKKVQQYTYLSLDYKGVIQAVKEGKYVETRCNTEDETCRGDREWKKLGLGTYNDLVYYDGGYVTIHEDRKFRMLEE